MTKLPDLSVALLGLARTASTAAFLPPLPSDEEWQLIPPDQGDCVLVLRGSMSERMVG